MLNCAWAYNHKWALEVRVVDRDELDLGKIGELSVIAGYLEGKLKQCELFFNSLTCQYSIGYEEYTDRLK
jgi:hypothetical protein